MSQVNRRILKLENANYGGHPYMVMVFGRNTAPVIPDDIGDREVRVMRIVFTADPVRDAAGNILNPHQDIDDDDPCYESVRAAMIARKNAKRNAA